MHTVKFAQMQAASVGLVGAEAHAKQPLISSVIAATALLDPGNTQAEDGGVFLVALPGTGHFVVELSTPFEAPMELGAWGKEGGAAWVEQPWGSDLPASGLLHELVTQGEWALPLFSQED